MFSLKEFLRREVRPALGCTEPGAVALAAARAAEELSRRSAVEAVEIRVSASLFKNGVDVAVPGGQGARGIPLAAALGVLCGRSARGLEALGECRSDHLEQARLWLDRGLISLCCDEAHSGVYAEVRLVGPDEEARCVIEGGHSRIALVERNGEEVFREVPAGSDGGPDCQALLGSSSFEALFDLVDGLDDEDEAFLLQGAALNGAVAEAGLDERLPSRLGLTRSLKALLDEEVLPDDLGTRIRLTCCAAAEARMCGVPLAVMSSAGSGNHGITAILPVALLARSLGATSRETARALALSHLATSFVKGNTGRLTPVCGCAVAAGAGAAVGMTWLLTEDRQSCAVAVKTLLADLAGLVCDGAKESCALKVATAAHEAYLAALLARRGSGVTSPQGLADESVAVTAANMGRLNREGMAGADAVILDILDERMKRDRSSC